VVVVVVGEEGGDYFCSKVEAKSYREYPRHPNRKKGGTHPDTHFPIAKQSMESLPEVVYLVIRSSCPVLHSRYNFIANDALRNTPSPFDKITIVSKQY
jgi:hypothetical protein